MTVKPNWNINGGESLDELEKLCVSNKGFGS